MSSQNNGDHPTVPDFSFTVENADQATFYETLSDADEKVQYGLQDDNSGDIQLSSKSEDEQKEPPGLADVESKACTDVFMMSQNSSQVNPSNNHSVDYGTLADKQAILELFRGRDENEILQKLYELQEKIKEIWAAIDEYHKGRNKCDPSQMYKKFEEQYQKHLSDTFGSQKALMSKALKMAQRPSFGVLIINSKNEVLGVQNYNGTWSAPKGHREIKKNGELETPWETFLRELFEEISIECKRNKSFLKLTEKNIGHYIKLDKDLYHESNMNSTLNSNDGQRLIGLFFIRIDEKKFKFALADHKENKKLKWLKIDDILKDEPKPNYDQYYSLRPFIQYFKDHPELFQKQ